MTADWGDLPLLADTSAWARVAHRADDWAAAVLDERIAVCGIVTLELLFSARDRREVTAMDDELAAFRNLAVTQGVVGAATRAMVELAQNGSDGSHRVSPADALVAACAADNGHAVLHYDRHYDRLATVLAFDSVWLAPAGAIP